MSCDYNIKCVFITMDKDKKYNFISSGIINDLKIINSKKDTIAFNNVPPTKDKLKVDFKDESLFDQNSFIQGALFYYNKMEEERKYLNDIKSNLNQKGITADLQRANESLEIFEISYLACRKMIDLIEYFNHNEIIDGDNRNSKVYCYISAIINS